MGTNILDVGLDDINVGDRQITRGRTITETDIALWCAVTGDAFQLHTDAEYASASRYGAPIAPGLMILAMTSGLGVPGDSPSVIANYGMDRVRYVEPVYVGDTIHSEMEVRAKRIRDESTGVLELHWTNMNQRDAVISVRTLLVLMKRRVKE
ncbi:MAG: MaoC family dehydratase [Acidimicrobiales bacterium]